ncbi:MAG: GXWXG domain-containing protein [Cellulosimicrobium funkei]
MTDPDTVRPGRSPSGMLDDLARGTTTAGALAFFDGLAPVDGESLPGFWWGSGLPTGHVLDGALEALGWAGKRFEPGGDAHPLLFDGAGGGLVDVNPALVPLPLVLRTAPALRRPPVARLVRALLHRGGVTAVMTYDALPVEDALRAVDDDTLVRCMEARGMGRPFFFVLRRATGQDTLPWSSRRQ